MRKSSYLAIGVIVGVVLGSSLVGFAQDHIKLIVNGKKIQSDVPPQIINGRTLVPARALAESLGAKVAWDATNNSVIVTSQNNATPVDIPTINNKIVKNVDVQSSLEWNSTGINVFKGQKISISASGRASWMDGSTDTWTDPDGNRFESPNSDQKEEIKVDNSITFPTASLGKLIGAIKMSNGQLSDPFIVGSNIELTVPTNGELMLGYNDNGNYDNKGSYQVTLSYQSE
jgi:hypothetical protein